MIPAVIDSLDRYIIEINKFPLLSKEEEFRLAYKWRDEQDIDAAHKLVCSHLRLVVKIAKRLKGYRLSMIDMISEGNLELMRSVKTFDPDRGFRLATLVMNNVSLFLKGYVYNNLSSVKRMQTHGAKKAFWHINKEKMKLGTETPNKDQIKLIAENLSVSEKDVEMVCEYQAETSMNTIDKYGNEFQDSFVSSVDIEKEYEEKETIENRNKIIYSALEVFDEREKDIFISRYLTEPPITLLELGNKYDVSRERIRQIEKKVYSRFKEQVLNEKNCFG